MFYLRRGAAAETIPFNFDNNHLMVLTTVNGVGPIWFLVDTGANYSIINHAVAALRGNMVADDWNGGDAPYALIVLTATHPRSSVEVAVKRLSQENHPQMTRMYADKTVLHLRSSASSADKPFQFGLRDCANPETVREEDAQDAAARHLEIGRQRFRALVQMRQHEKKRNR
ncbi:MAG TPA: hypothetical protein VLC46_04090 [Thermoanaerobaculia bacterium]|jgi:hypothetical protein|nr:hypothetical protein [Thermoanaerobaculia bacterium]